MISEPRCRQQRDGPSPYTEIVRRRILAFAVALLVGATPAMALVCQLDCDAPIASAPSCHKAAADQGSTHVRDVSHACRDSHTTPDATLASASSRDVSAGWIAVVTPFATPLVFAVNSQPVAAHGPPGAGA